MNYQLLTDKIIEEVKKSKKVPTLLVHSCCGPCSSYVLEYLSKYFLITILYFNPNIYPEDEYLKRLGEQKKVILKTKSINKISLVEGDYSYQRYLDYIKGYEKEKEGGERCFKCYRLRMEEAAKYAKDNGFDYFTTTLSISPYKNALKLNEIGEELEKEYGVKYLYADFKKRNGYKRSLELSKEFDLYRQHYCGCGFSLNDSNS